MKHFDPRTVTNAALAYLGDAVIEICVRERLLEEGYTTSKALNAHARDYVSAPAQAAAMERLHPHLTEEEAAVFRRGRNMGHTNTPKHATVAEYRSATGMEALFGYLHLTEQQARIDELFALAYPREV
ncbi:MAG: ribonuclease III [Clostridia bacterium]|nr:ribonuclease III [Clostridia bacterium]